MIDDEMIPHLIKYMGSKREILTEICAAIGALEVKTDWFCDLFAGTSIVSYAMSDQFNILSNDIQQYSSVFARTYFGAYDYDGTVSELLFSILQSARGYIDSINDRYPYLLEMSSYSDDMTYEAFVTLEGLQKQLVDKDIEMDYTLFTRCYSGTYWSLSQCEWIDALRRVADDYKDQNLYYAILSSIVYAMSYSSQSTGHFAQYRKVSRTNYKNILLYRKRSIAELFAKKLEEILVKSTDKMSRECIIMSLDYRECLEHIPEGSIVYADPPYSNVHYSRFYHVVETLVRYDNPTLKYTGRYRTDRHQSPFDQAKHVKEAFADLFKGVKSTNSHLIISYSDNGMLTPNEIISIGNEIMGDKYEYAISSKEYSHMKMGRTGNYKMDVNELLITFKRV